MILTGRSKTDNPKKDGDLHVISNNLFAKVTGIFKRTPCFIEQKYWRSIMYNSLEYFYHYLLQKPFYVMIKLLFLHCFRQNDRYRQK